MRSLTLTMYDGSAGSSVRDLFGVKREYVQSIPVQVGTYRPSHNEECLTVEFCQQLSRSIAILDEHCPPLLVSIS